MGRAAVAVVVTQEAAMRTPSVVWSFFHDGLQLALVFREYRSILSPM